MSDGGFMWLDVKKAMSVDVLMSIDMKKVVIDGVFSWVEIEKS